MNFKNDAAYRLRLAEGFLREAEQDFDLQRWRSCVDNAQLAVENSGKTILSLYGPLERTHDPAYGIQKLIHEQVIHRDLIAEVEGILPLMEELGAEDHFLTDYGDEETYRDPWVLFGRGEGQETLTLARQCVIVAKRVFDFTTRNGKI